MGVLAVAFLSSKISNPYSAAVAQIGPEFSRYQPVFKDNHSSSGQLLNQIVVGVIEPEESLG